MNVVYTVQHFHVDFAPAAAAAAAAAVAAQSFSAVAAAAAAAVAVDVAADVAVAVVAKWAVLRAGDGQMIMLYYSLLVGFRYNL